MRTRFVDPKILGRDIAALHPLTHEGRKLGIPNDEIWIAEDLRTIAPVLRYHEEVEYRMERDGMQHAAAHRRALERESAPGSTAR